MLNTPISLKRFGLDWLGDDEKGLWSVFRLIPSDLGAQFQEGGRLAIGDCVLLDLCMSRSQWNHQARKVMKLWWAVKGRVPLCEALAVNWRAVNMTVGKGWRRSESASSLVSGSFLCASRLCRDFADMSPMCPCGSLDTQIHRLLWCPKTSEDRRIVGWTDEDERTLLRGGRFWAEKGVCRMQDGILRQENPEFEPAPFLKLLTQEDVEAGRKLGDDQGWVLGEIQVKTWRRGARRILAGSVAVNGVNKVYCLNGLRESEVVSACFFKIAILARVARKRCCIRVHVPYLLETFRTWLSDTCAPWTSLRLLLSQDDLSWISVSDIAPDAKLARDLLDWARRRDPEDILKNLDLHDKIAAKVQFVSVGVGDKWSAGWLAHKQRERRIGAKKARLGGIAVLA